MGGTTNGKDCMELLKTLSRDEILEVLSQGLCKHCDAVLQTRVRSLGINDDMSISSDETNLTDKKGEHSKSEITLESRPGGGGGNKKKYSNRDKGDGVNYGICSFSIDDDGLTDEQEHIRFAQVGRNKNFTHIDRIKGKSINVLQGLQLYTQVFNSEEQKKIVDYIFTLQSMGQKGQLKANTYSEPRKWMRGKGRVTIQFGCCYNYVLDKKGNPPGIMKDGEIDPLPFLFKQMIKRMVRWTILPTTCVPDSCIVNIYEKGDCIPPHIDHHDFLRPFCTVSFLSECNILFGKHIKSIAPGEFDASISIPLPIGSVLILNGNAADVAKHCVPSVPFQRISVTFRKMDPSKLPNMHTPETDLMGIKPLVQV